MCALQTTGKYHVSTYLCVVRRPRLAPAVPDVVLLASGATSGIPSSTAGSDSEMVLDRTDLLEASMDAEEDVDVLWLRVERVIGREKVKAETSEACAWGKPVTKMSKL